MKKIIFLCLGHGFLSLGVVGAFLPVLPTTPFLLLAAFFYSKSNSHLLNWLKNHRIFGPPLQDWQSHGVIGIKAKWLATIMILLVLLLRIRSLNTGPGIKLFAALVLTAVLIFIWSRPSGRR